MRLHAEHEEVGSDSGDEMCLGSASSPKFEYTNRKKSKEEVKKMRVLVMLEWSMKVGVDKIGYGIHVVFPLMC